jgi:hypothetical protein
MPMYTKGTVPFVYTINQNRAIPIFLNQHPQFIPFGKNAMNVPVFKSFVLKNEPFTGDYKFVIKHYW